MLIFGQPHIEKKEISEVLNTLKSGWLGTGPKVQKFETVIFDAELLFPELKQFLGEQDAWGTLHFDSQSVYP